MYVYNVVFTWLGEYKDRRQLCHSSGRGTMVLRMRFFVVLAAGVAGQRWGQLLKGSFERQDALDPDDWTKGFPEAYEPKMPSRSDPYQSTARAYFQPDEIQCPEWNSYLGRFCHETHARVWQDECMVFKRNFKSAMGFDSVYEAYMGKCPKDTICAETMRGELPHVVCSKDVALPWTVKQHKPDQTESTMNWYRQYGFRELEAGSGNPNHQMVKFKVTVQVKHDMDHVSITGLLVGEFPALATTQQRVRY